MNNNIKFEYADAWLLLSIIYAKQRGQATVADIIGYGDFINHAILSLEELQGGMYRLISSGYVAKERDEFKPTDKISIPYKQFTKKNNPVDKELEFIRKELNSPEWSEEYDPSKANQSGSYNDITKDVFDKAYKEYTDKMNN